MQMDFRFSSISKFDFHSTVVTVIVRQLLLQLLLLTYGACLCVGLEYDNRG